MLHNGANGSVPPADDLNQHGKRIQELIEQIDRLVDPEARELLQQCMEAVLAFYGQGLARMIEVAKGVAPEGQKVYDALARDDIVRGFLLIHGLHPLDLRTRLSEALDKVRPYIKSHGGNVELISLQDDVARLRLIGHCKSCPSFAVTLELAVGQAIEEACPDLLEFEVEGFDTAPLNSASQTAQNLHRDWIVIDGAQQLSNGDLMPVQASGVALLICKVTASSTLTAIDVPPVTCRSIWARWTADFSAAAQATVMTCSARVVASMTPISISTLFRCSSRTAP